MVLIKLFMTLVFSLLPEEGIIFFWNFMTQTGSSLTILYVKIDPYSGLKIDPEFWVKYIDPGFRVNLTRFASVAY